MTVKFMIKEHGEGAERLNEYAER